MRQGILAITGAVLVSCAGAPSHIEDRTAVEPSMTEPPLDPVTVSFPTADGGIVFADDAGAGVDAVVLAHGGRFTKESWSEQVPVLVDEGFRVVAIDFRGRGQSRGPGRATDADHVHQDVLAAVRHLRETGAATVSVVGASFGGWAAARAAVAEPGAIDRLVLMASPSIDNPEQLPGRKLFITTRGDFYGPGNQRLPNIRDQFERAPEPKDLVILEGDAHAQFIFGTDQADLLMDEILRFLTEP